MAIIMKASKGRPTSGPSSSSSSSSSSSHGRLLSSPPSLFHRNSSFSSSADTHIRDPIISSTFLKRSFPAAGRRSSLSSTKLSTSAPIFTVPSRSASQVGALEALLSNPLRFVPATILTFEDEAKMVAVLRPRKVARKNESTIQRQQRLLHRHISPHWGRQRSADLRSQGMPNWNGVLCYRHSGLQGLLHVPKFVNWLEQEHTGDNCTVTDCLACALRSLSEVYWWSPPPTTDIQREAIRKALVRIDVVASRLGWYTSTRHPNQHQDAEEQIHWLLLTLQTQLPPAASSTLSSLFTIDLLSTITCGDRTSTRRKCGHRSTTSETQLNLQLNIPPSAKSNNAHPRLTSYITTSLHETLTSYTCASCTSDAPKRRIYTITNAAPILIVQQKRFAVNPHTGRTSKLTHHVAFSEWLDLSSHADDASEEVKYRLVSVVNHAGGLGAGHYKTLAKGPDTKWWDINDDVVRRGTLKDAVQPGGKWTPYLLIYERVERCVAS